MFAFADFVEKLLLFRILTLQPVAVDVTYTVDSLHFINEDRWNIRLHELFSLFLDARSTREVGHTCSVTPCIYRTKDELISKAGHHPAEINSRIVSNCCNFTSSERGCTRARAAAV